MVGITLTPGLIKKNKEMNFNFSKNIKKKEINYIIHNNGYDIINEPFIASSNGSFLKSTSGEKYFDPGLGAGSQILGYSNKSITNAIKKQIEKGSIYLHNNLNIQSFTKKLTEILPSEFTNFIYCNSGSEATQRALRIARVATGRKKIAYFQGGWHGMNEWTMNNDGERFGKFFIPKEDGITKNLRKDSILLPYNDDKAFEIIQANSNDLACIIVEPVQGSNPRNDITNFLNKIQQTCKEFDIIFILDEIITGFRLGIGGASKLWNLHPDIITYGKIIGGGLPIGLVSLTNEISSRSFGDKNKSVPTGGTFSANPLVATAGLSVLNILETKDYNYINQLGELMRSLVNSYFKKYRIPLSVIGTNSISRLVFTDQKFKNRMERDYLEQGTQSKQIEFRKKMLCKNILWPNNGILFTGFCNTKKEIENLANKINETSHEVFL